MFQPHHRAPSRFFDHLYDPLYITSGQRDVQRHNQRALAASAVVDIVPSYHTMFTDLPWRPRNYFVPKPSALPNLHAFMSHRPSDPVDTAVDGVDRAKYFGKPLVNRRTIALRLQLDAGDCLCIPKPESPVPPPRAVACQTDYRIQSAQTRPWMPDPLYAQPPTCAFDRPDTPELLRVARMLSGDPNAELPGLYEAQMVVQARKRRAFERSLPAPETAADWERRRAVLEAFEWEAWLAREKKIEYLQRLRLGMVKRLMAEREFRKRTRCEEQTRLTNDRIEAAKCRKLQQLRSAHRRKQRHLDVWHKGTNLRWRPVDVVTEHIDPTSELYVPIRRFGEHPKQRHFKLCTTYFESKWDPDRQAPPVPRAACAERAQQAANSTTGADVELQELYRALQALRSHRDDAGAMSKCLQPIAQKNTAVWPTGMDKDAKALHDEKFQAMVYLQKVLRGRVVQKELCEGRIKFKPLSAEYQSTHQLADIVQLNMLQWRNNRTTIERQRVHKWQRQLAALMKAENHIWEPISQVISTTICFALDLLESEMTRVVDHRKAQALGMLAEAERYRREAAEAGRRQLSENRRRFHDECASSITTARQNTVCHYLENVLVDGMDQMAERRARTQIRATVQQIDREAAAGLETSSAEAVVAGVLQHDILPDVWQHIARENYLADVHRSLFGELPADRIGERFQLRQAQSDALAAPRQADCASRLQAEREQRLLEERARRAPPPDPAHDEAMQCIERVLAKVLRRTDDESADGAASGSILDDLVSSVPVSALIFEDDTTSPEARSARSENQERLQEIVQSVNEAVWGGDETDGIMLKNESETAKEGVVVSVDAGMNVRGEVHVSFLEMEEVAEEEEDED